MHSLVVHAAVELDKLPLLQFSTYCNNEVLSKLCKPLKYPVPYSRTKRHQPFLNYALNHFQNSKQISVFYSSFYVVNCVLCTVYF